MQLLPEGLVSNKPARSMNPARHADAASRAGGWLRAEEAIMGTSVSVELWSDERRAGEAAIAAVMADMHRIDRTMSPVQAASDLSRINREAATQAVPLSDELYALLDRALHFSRLSEGAFDITYASVGQFYDYREQRAPSDEQLATARAAIGWQQLLLDPVQRTVRFGHPGMRIDLGGFAKGHAVDRAAAILRRHGIAHAVVAAGGDSYVLGDRRGRPWNIAVRDPRRPGEVVAVLPLEDVAMSTSGDYERFFERDGVRFHHVIDPKTGRSPSGIRSVTILAEDGLTTEGLSKSVFVKGLEEGMRLVESQEGVDAIVVDAEGVLHYSSGLLGAAPPAGNPGRQ